MRVFLSCVRDILNGHFFCLFFCMLRCCPAWRRRRLAIHHGDCMATCCMSSIDHFSKFKCAFTVAVGSVGVTHIAYVGVCYQFFLKILPCLLATFVSVVCAWCVSCECARTSQFRMQSLSKGPGRDSDRTSAIRPSPKESFQNIPEHSRVILPVTNFDVRRPTAPPPPPPRPAQPHIPLDAGTRRHRRWVELVAAVRTLFPRAISAQAFASALALSSWCGSRRTSCVGRVGGHCN